MMAELHDKRGQSVKVNGRGPSAAALKMRERELADAVRRHLREAFPEQTTGLEADAPPRAEWQLVHEGTLAETDVLDAYLALTGLPRVEGEGLGELSVFPGVTHDFLAEHACLPVEWGTDYACLAVWHPFALGQLAYQWNAMFGHIPSFKLIRRSELEHLLTRFYALHKSDELSADWLATDTSEQALKDLAHEAPVVRLVNDMFNRAVEAGASDIHVEPGENELMVRYRIDGILHTVLTPPLAYFPAVASRLKLIAGMNIAERRLPQDGRIDLTVSNRKLDVRASTVPSMHGESIVLRLLQKDTRLFDLDNLGIEGDTHDKFMRLLKKPYGMILVVGPTGSGKTTTLYGAMKLLQSEATKIITIEDPVEYQMPGLTQIQVRPQIGLTFAHGLRSIVRQDPDIILVGEIRDRETAEIAVHAALTGHLVLSTLHTNDAAGAISRLLEMGIEGFLLSSSLLGVLSQRLVRRICNACEGRGTIASPDEEGEAKPCRICAGTGYRGRAGIFEMLMVEDHIRNAINERRDSSEIARLARQGGMRSLQEDGERKVATGLTTPAEVARVCQLEVED